VSAFIRNQKDYVVADELDFKKMGGRLPAILQDYPTGNVLGLDYMDKESLYMTVDTKRLMTPPASRLRNLQIPVFYILTDCDKDCLLLGVTQGEIYGFYNGELVRILDEFVLEGDPDFRKGNGLIPAVVQDADTNDVLMQAYMSKESWDMTRRKGLATFWK
jgi:phosphoribosyl-AMP cyclohydrolase